MIIVIAYLAAGMGWDEGEGRGGGGGCFYCFPAVSHSLEYR